VDGVKYFRLDKPEWADMSPVLEAIAEAIAEAKRK
jgi:hypothetical protein